ncbi:MAG TPA: hypothetical protein VN695_06665 [Streptosporangiaceae bacterium]|nr:hypothetical protein [Streptosporangiaceae bacterium]
MVIFRKCDQCGASFTPRREHARFCSARCRVAWNRDHQADPAAGKNALAWSVIAMADATNRLAKVTASDRPRAFAVVGEAVWWVTIVDSTLVRYHAEAYDLVLSRVSDIKLIEETLAGFRFVRNQIGQGVDHADFIYPTPGQSDGAVDHVGDWIWSRQPEPACASLSAQGRAWEMARYLAYEARLAGHTVGQTFSDAAGFLIAAADLARGGAPGRLSDQARAARRGR